MIFLVPISPEVPPKQKPRLWQGLLLIIFLGVVYLLTQHYFAEDFDFITRLESLPIPTDQRTGTPDYSSLNQYLEKRPLLEISPARGDWDLRRLLYANFLHEGTAHLLLNLIGVFAGIRICSTFIPFGCSLAIFLLGGSLGLLSSLYLTTEATPYIPHLGSSAGLFALMGAYYVYNFRYRTRYFFWFPSRRGFISLRTSWFFFVDALLMEIVLSLAQLFPSHIDSVDHLAHVVGFTSGMGLAALLRLFQRWPGFLQVRREFLLWRAQVGPDTFSTVHSAFDQWIRLLEVNQYNDQVKLRLCGLVRLRVAEIDDERLAKAFRFLSPTFIRLHPESVALMIRHILEAQRQLPESWLKETPYDSIIRLAKHLAAPQEEQSVLLAFVSAYRRTHPEGGDIERKLELLTRKLSGLLAPEARRRPATPPPVDKSKVG